MRRILKQVPNVKDYIEKAVETGIYRTSDEINTAVELLRKGQGTGVEPRVLVDRFRRDIIRGTEVQDYPAEYHILAQHPPIPRPPKVPKKIQRRMEAQRPKHPTEKLVKKYMKRQELANKSHATTEDYYQKLLGIKPPSGSMAMGQKSAAVSQAYAFAVKQYEVMRTQDLSEKDALDIVEKLLAEEKRQEGHVSREIASSTEEWAKTGARSSVRAAAAAAEVKDSDDEQELAASVKASLPSILHDQPRVVEGMMQWSRMLQKSGIPYQEWTVGASTALDHWIARNILQLSEATWDALLEGNDPSLLSRGQDIVTIRETLFPETRIDDSREMEGKGDEEREEDESDFNAFASQFVDDDKESSEDKSVDELLASLRGLDAETSPKVDRPSSDHSVESGENDPIDALTDELQEWRSKNVKSPYEQWSDSEQQKFSVSFCFRCSDWERERLID
jgi:hypothetical protein